MHKEKKKWIWRVSYAFYGVVNFKPLVRQINAFESSICTFYALPISATCKFIRLENLTITLLFTPLSYSFFFSKLDVTRKPDRVYVFFLFRFASSLCPRDGGCHHHLLHLIIDVNNNYDDPISARVAWTSRINQGIFATS